MRDLLRAGIMVCALAGLSTAANAATQTYQGNGGTGFGGAIGNSVLTVSDSGSGIINFSLATGVPFSGNDLVLYIDSKAGGVNNNSTFTDNGDGGREAISGYNASNTPPSRALVTFPAGFGADFAVSIEPNVFAGLFNLSTPTNFGFIASANLSGSGSGPFTFSLNRSDLGLGPTDPFSFVGTLISTTAYRSNETIGTSVTTPGTAGDTPNSGFTGTQTFATADTFAVPEPSGIIVVGLLGAAGLLRRRRA
jgi:hypothetical protein